MLEGSSDERDKYRLSLAKCGLWEDINLYPLGSNSKAGRTALQMDLCEEILLDIGHEGAAWACICWALLKQTRLQVWGFLLMRAQTTIKATKMQS